MANKKKYQPYKQMVENKETTKFPQIPNVKQYVGNVIKLFVAAIVASLVLAIIMAVPTMWIWNWVMPSLCGFGKLSVLKSFGLIFLCSTLFKSVNYSQR